MDRVKTAELYQLCVDVRRTSTLLGAKEGGRSDQGHQSKQKEWGEAQDMDAEEQTEGFVLEWRQGQQ